MTGSLPPLKLSLPLLFGSIFAATSMLAIAAEPPLTAADEIAFEHESVSLSGMDDRWQLLLTKKTADGQIADVTRLATISVEPAIAVVNSSGYVTPLSNGSAVIRAILGDAPLAEIPLEIVGTDVVAPVNFPGRVVPIFTKLGCNGGGCHGKAAGQAGFRLSLLGFAPHDDYERLVVQSRGRRMFPAVPEKSLLLTKAVNETPHGGGQRLDVDSHEYRILRRWIAGGMPYGSADAPELSSIDVFPKKRILDRNAQQQISVVARFSDGSIEDITHTAQFESNNTDLANVDDHGLVSLGNQPGDVAVMARYQGHVAVFRAGIPLGAQIAKWPNERNIVDQLAFEKLRTLGIPPSDLCDDSTFIRRVTLDLCGRLPTAIETKNFLASGEQDKYEATVDRLLASTDYAEYFAKKWSSILRSRRASAGYKFGNFAFHDWLQTSFSENKSYDQFVRELITASGSIELNPPVAWLREVSGTESRIEDTAQLFLGQRIQCARCHHHPFEKWSQDDYFHMAAFYSKVSKKSGDTPDQPIFVSRTGGASSRQPQTGQNLRPSGLDATECKLGPADDPREHLVDWMVRKDNPFFARCLVNRYWKHFFAIGMVEPEDDMRVTNPPSNPELLDGLAEYFVESGYDLKSLLRLICTSSTYRLSSDANEFNLQDRSSYSRYYPKRLQAEVLLDAIDTVALTETDFSGLPLGTRAVGLPDTGYSSYFLDAFGKPAATTACECERSNESTLAQSLHLLNSKEVQSKLSSDTGHAAAMAASSQPIETIVNDLYLTAVSRPANETEIKTAVTYVRSHDDRRAAFEDLVWAIINSKEFLFNH